MGNYSKIYWLTRLEPLHDFFFGIIIICGIYLGVYFLVKMLGGDEGEIWHSDYQKKYGRWIRLSIILIFVSGLSKTFIPTRNEAIVIMVGGKTMNFAESDTSLKRVPHQATAIISSYMDNILEDLKKDKKKKDE